jgi:hypothetical protein
MNAYFDGVDLPDLQVRLSLSEHPPTRPHHGGATRSHNSLQAMLGAATRTGSRRAVLAELRDATLGLGAYGGSREGLTPIREDPPSALAVAVVLGQLMIRPGSANDLTHRTIQRYSLGDAIDRIARTTPDAAGLGSGAPLRA